MKSEARRASLFIAFIERRACYGVFGLPSLVCSPVSWIVLPAFSAVSAEEADVMVKVLEAMEARLGARLLFVSPIFATRSHVGAKGIGRRGLARLVHQTDRPVIALGGMTRARFKALRGMGVCGWAAIDGLSVEQA